MSEVLVKAEERTDFGKNASRRLRTQGRIPAVVYGRDFQTLGISVSPQDMVNILHSESGRNTIFGLQVKGKRTDVLIRDFQLDPIKGNLLHIDLQAVALDQIMQFEVPVMATGTAVGVKEGGILDIVLRGIEVECLPGDVPDHIVIDVSSLEIGDSIRISDLSVDPKVTVLSEPDLVVLTLVPPRVHAEEAEEGEEEAAEPELIRKGKEEAEESE